MWEAEPVTITADEAMTPVEGGERTMTEEGVDFLRDILSAGRVLYREVKQPAKDADISEKSLRRARERLNVVVDKEGSEQSSRPIGCLAPHHVCPLNPLMPH